MGRHPSQQRIKPSYDLERFVDAQASVYPRVIAELQRGEKASLGARLLECAELVLGVKDKTAVGVFQETDAMKLRSNATLFAEVSPAGSVFHRIVDQYFDGNPDAQTLNLLFAGMTAPLWLIRL